jgi:dolichol-phosphate mannosyltransferase
MDQVSEDVMNYSSHVAVNPPADLTMVVPTYNERDRLGELVRSIFQACGDAGVHLELVIVDDHSPDGTGALADELARTFRMTVVHRSGKLGLGTAVVAGFAVATTDIVGVMDADFSHPPLLVPRMLAAFKATGADVLVASRYVPGGATRNWPLSRRLMSRFACLLARPVSPIRDAASGFFLIRRDIARGVVIQAGGFKICLELIVRGWPRTLVELPYTFDDREEGESKMSWREAAGYLVQLRDLLKVRWSGGTHPARRYVRLTQADVERFVQAR